MCVTSEANTAGGYIEEEARGARAAPEGKQTDDISVV